MNFTTIRTYSDGAKMIQADDLQFTVARDGRIQWSDNWILISDLALAGLHGFSQVHGQPFNHTDVYFNGTVSH